MIVIDFLCLDDRGEPVSFEFEITRADLIRIAVPYVLRSITISRQVIQEARLGPADIEKVILVGSSSLTSLFHEQLADSSEGLGIPLDVSIDPNTVIAQGAAIFAGTLRPELQYVYSPTVKIQDSEPAKSTAYTLELEYDPVGMDPEPLVGGKIIGASDENFTGFSIEFIDELGKYRSGKIPVGSNGAFITILTARSNMENTFHIELTDPSNRVVPCSPAEIKHRVTLPFPDFGCLIQSIGLALPRNEVAWLVMKGTSLPAHQRQVIRTTSELHHDSFEALCFSIIEGQSERGDRNRLIGTLTITGQHMPKDLPKGSEIEITLAVDIYRLVTVSAFIPFLDQETAVTLDIQKPKPDLVLNQTFAQAKQRLQNLRADAEKSGNPIALRLLQEKVDGENMVEYVENTLVTANDDTESANNAQNHLLDLCIILDEIEDHLTWPDLVGEAEKKIRESHELMKFGNVDNRQYCEMLEREALSAVQNRESELLRRKLDEIDRLVMQVINEQPVFWVTLFEDLKNRQDNMFDQAIASELIQQGDQAIQVDNLRKLIRNHSATHQSTSEGSIPSSEKI